jgi:hypothetical protein
MKSEYFMYAGWAMVVISFIGFTWLVIKFVLKTAPETRIAQPRETCSSTLTRAQKSARRRKTKAQKAARRKSRS